jgi:hypothetical protein
MATGAVIARILSQYSDKGSKAAQKDIAKLGKRIDAFGAKATKSFALVGAATAAYAAKLAIDAVKGAAADEKQQAALAVALRNTTGATDAAIAANAKYLDSLELQVAIDNEKLIPALQQLVTATGDLAQGQALLSLATDVSAASGKDLGAVSTALSRAVNGNMTALTRLGIPLDANAVKSKNLSKLLLDLSKVSKGQAAASAATFSGQVTKLGLAFNQIKDSIGLAFMPELSRMVFYIENKVLPNLQAFLDMNKYKLTNALATTTKNIQEIARAFGNIFNFINKVNNILPVGIAGWIQIAAVIKGLTIVYGVLTTALGIYIALQTIADAKTQSSTVATRNLAAQLTLNATGYTANAAALTLLHTKMMAGSKIYPIMVKGLKAIAAAIRLILPKPLLLLFAAMTAVYVIGKKIINNFEKQKVVMSDTAKAADRAMMANSNYANSMDAAHEKYKRNQEEKASMTDEERKQQELFAQMEARNAKEQARRDAAEAKRNAVLARLKKLSAIPGTGKPKIGKGITPVSSLEAAEYEAINLRAAELLLIKQKDNQLELDKLKKLKENIFLQEVRNTLSERYIDILQVLGDQKITDDEVKALALGWKLPVEAVRAYLIEFQAVSDGVISDKEVEDLAKSWGSTKEQAEKYLDFTVALSDTVLRDDEIQKLMSKWKLTEEQVRQYADFVGVVSDGTLEDKEIVKLKDKWKLSTDQVVAYIKEVGAPVAYNGSMLTTAQAAELAWKNATAALEEFLRKQREAAAGGFGPGKTTVVPPVVVVPPKTDGTSKTDSAASSEIQKQIDALKELKKDAPAGTIAGFRIKEQIDELTDNLKNGTQAAATIVDEQTKRAGQIASAQAAAATVSTFNSGSFRMADAASMSSFDSAVATEYDERFRFAGMNLKSPTLDNAKSMVGSGFNSGGNQTINVTVNGSVTTEQDLVQTIRTGLLTAQQNGQGLTLQAI